MKTSKLNLIYLLIITLSINSCGVPKMSTVTNFNVQDCAVTLTNGTQINGKVDFPLNSGEKKLTIDKNNIKEKIDKAEISKVTFKTSSGEINYEKISVFNQTGRKILKEKKLLALSIKGKVSLCYSQGSGYENRGTGQNPYRVPVFFTEYYCIRENEKAATLIHADMNVVNKNSLFRYAGKKYFADDSEIAKKIDDKVYTYSNLIEVINKYNSK
jgi:hypothetical protein